MGTPPLAIRQYMDQVQVLSDQAWQKISPLLQARQYARGELFAQKDRVARHFGVLSEGIFKAYHLNADGQSSTQTIFTPLHFQQPIAYIGALTSLLTGQASLIQIKALTPATVWVGQYDQWLALGQQYPEIASWSRRMMELFVVSKEQAVQELTEQHAEQRYENFKLRYPELEALIPQYEIANFLHISPTQLSRIRSAKFFGRAND